MMISPVISVVKCRYLRFTTEMTGDIIISEGLLMPKGQNTK